MGRGCVETPTPAAISRDLLKRLQVALFYAFGAREWLETILAPFCGRFSRERAAQPVFSGGDGPEKGHDRFRHSRCQLSGRSGFTPIPLRSESRTSVQALTKLTRFVRNRTKREAFAAKRRRKR